LFSRTVCVYAVISSRFSLTLAGLIQADQISEGLEMVILYLTAPRWIKYATNIHRVPSFWEPVEALKAAVPLLAGNFNA